MRHPQRSVRSFTGTVLTAVCLATVIPCALVRAGNDLPCLIKPQREVVLGSQVIGVLDRMLVDRGDLVSHGQVLATLESSVEQAELALARAKAELEAPLKQAEVKSDFASRKLARAKDLRQRTAIAEHELDEAEAEDRLAKVAKL